VSAVIEHIDSGADLSGTTSDSGSGSTTTQGVSDTSHADLSANQESGGTAGRPDSGTTTVGPGSDSQSTVGSEGKDKLVPIAALHESRETIKALKTQIAALEAQPKLSAEDADLLKDLRAQKKAAQEPKDPDFLEDPKGYVDAKAKQTAEALKKLNEATEKQTQQQEQQQQLNQILSGVQQHEQAFLKTTPDYTSAIDHIRTVRASQLQMLYPQATQQQIHQQITAEEIGAAAQVLRAGGNPAEFAYNYAKTVGYQPKTAVVADPNAAANGTVKPDKDAVRSMGGGGGSEATGEDDANAMPEFASALAERFGVKKRK
jgi:hypothetical protein